MLRWAFLVRLYETTIKINKKPIKIDLFLLLVLSLLLITPILNNKYQFFRWVVYNALLLCRKAFGCSQIRSFRFYLNENSQQSFHYTFLGCNTLYITSWKVHNFVRLWPQQVQLRGVTSVIVSTTAVKILEMNL